MNYESKITDAYSKNLSAWLDLQEQGKWTNGEPITDKTMFVPASLCAGYERQCELLRDRMGAALDEFLTCAGCNVGNQKVVDAFSRYFDGITVEGKEKMVRKIFETCNDDDRAELIEKLVQP